MKIVSPFCDNQNKITLDIEFERDWSFFRRYVGQRTHRKLKTIYLSNFKDFPEKSIVTLFSFECTINPQNLIKIVGAIF